MYYAARLSELAERERFVNDWQLVGSMTPVGDRASQRRRAVTARRTGQRITGCNGCWAQEAKGWSI